MADNALTVYQKVDNPIAFADQMAETVSALISCDIRQGKAMAIQMLCEGLNPMQLQRRYHWIQGRPSMRADAMRAEFRMNYGGDFEIIESSGDCAHIKFTDAKGREYPSKITWQDAQQESWPWKKGCGPGTDKTEPTIANLKDNWATPLSRANMLMARATSTALRYICPELVAGVYTPEEMEDVARSQASEPAAPRETASQILAAQVAEQEREAASQSSVIAEADGDDQAEEAEFEMKAPATDPAAPGSVTAEQLAEIEEIGQYAFRDEWAAARDKALAVRNCQTLRNLSAEQAGDLLVKLREKKRQRDALEKN